MSTALRLAETEAVVVKEAAGLANPLEKIRHEPGIDLSLKPFDEASWHRRLRECHREGLSRAVKIAMLHANYGEILTGKIPANHRDLFDGPNLLEEKLAAAIEENRNFISNKTINIVQIEHSGPCCFGNTQNNLREFRFFDELVQSCASIMENNLSKAPRRRHTITDSDRKLIGSILDDISAFYRSLNSINSSLFHQQFLYTRSFISIALGIYRATTLPSLLVIANDHMPVHIAFSMAMKAAGVPRVYLQHAEVTPSFPALDFEFCVLRNEKSLNVYKAVGEIAGKTFIIPRSSVQTNFNALRRDPGHDIRVVIYPTARIISDNLRAMINALKANPMVRSLAIKPHPNTRPPLSDILQGDKIEILESTPSDDHIALVGNSSIAIELLQSGIRVYQNFEIDPIRRDYYGFVEDGLVIEAPIPLLSQKFWGPYPVTPEWMHAYRRQVPEDDAAAEAARRDFASAVRPYLANAVTALAHAATVKTAKPRPRPAPRLSSAIAGRIIPPLARAFPAFFADLANTIQRHLGTKQQRRRERDPAAEKLKRALFAHAVSAAESPSAVVNKCLQERLVSNLDAILVFNNLFQTRSPALRLLFSDVDSILSGPVKIWLELKKSAWTLDYLKGSEALKLSDAVYAYRDHNKVRSLLIDALIANLLQSGSLEDIDRFFSQTGKRPGELSTNRQIAYLNRLKTLGTPKTELNFRRLELEKEASPFRILKFRNMDALQGEALASWRHKEAEEEFLSAARNTVSNELKTEILPIYEKVRHRLNLIDIRNDPASVTEVRDDLISALRSGEGLSLLRLSDGEAYFFADDATVFTPEDVSNRERHWWGIELEEDRRRIIANGGVEALRNANIVGIPSIYRFIRDTSEGTKSLTASVQGRGLVEVLKRFEEVVPLNAKITEDKANVCLFSRVDHIEALAREAKKTVIVSSVRFDALPSELRALNVESIPIPTHFRTSTNSIYHTEDRALPLVYEPLLQRVVSTSQPGTLVLVAGGIVGKLFVGAAKSKGAVAIDIGSVVDDWVSGGTSLR